MIRQVLRQLLPGASASRGPGGAVVVLRGALEARGARRVERRLRRAAARRPAALVVDMARVRSVSSGAAGALAQGLRAATVTGVPAVIRGANPAVRQVLRRYGLDRLATHRD